MAFYKIIGPSANVVGDLIKSHLLPTRFLWFTISKVQSMRFSYDNDDEIGFVTILSKSGIQVSYELRNDLPCYVEFTGFPDNIRYDISWPETSHPELFKILQNYGARAKFPFGPIL